MSHPRIVSLLPGATEIIAALGFGDRLVGRSHECDQPPEITAGLPSISAPRLDPGGESGAIDRSVRALLEQALSIYRIDAERLRALQPDIIVTQTLCEVCAVSPADLQEALARWSGKPAQIVAMTARDLGGIYEDIQRIAIALDCPDAGARLNRRMRHTLQSLTPPPSQAPPRVACIEWLEPLMLGGNWAPELVELAGGRNILTTAGEHSPFIEWETLRQADPEVLIVVPCGFGLAQSRRDISLLTARPGFRDLAAVRSGRIFLIDGNRYFNRPGPALMQTAEILAEIVSGGARDFGHRGRGYEPL